MTLLSGKRCLVFDRDDGIGAAVVDVIRAEGGQVWRAGGSEFHFEGRASKIEGACAAAINALGKLDAIVGPAPTLAAVRPQDWDSAAWAQLSAEHGVVTSAIGKAALKYLSPNGAVCFLGSIYALAGSTDSGFAGSAHAALGPMTKALALEGASCGVRANAIYLGLVDTPSVRRWCIDRAAVNKLQTDVFARTVAKIPMRRAGTAQEVAKSTAFLLSDRARHINGVTVLVDGGMLYA